MNDTMTANGDLGIFGLSTMGANLARNAARKGFTVAVYNRTTAKTDDLIREHGSEGAFVAAKDVTEFVAALKKPRAIMMMVKAGKPTQDVIDEIVPHLESGDILIDGGNSLLSDTQKRAKALAEKHIRYLGVGVSGGEEGALEGPSIMPGGDPDAYERVRPMFEKMAAQVDGTPCCTYIGTDGAGHYVKMVHNGIEYADMQLIAEAYAVMRNVFGYDAAKMAEVFEQWNEGDLNSYLIEITAKVLRKRDDASGGALVDVIVDKAEQKGTGRWTVQDALELGSPITGIAEAVFARTLSSFKSQRETASKAFAQTAPVKGNVDASELDAIRDALYASKIVAYAQGFAQLTAAAEHYEWKLDLAKIATIWRGGCIIRARFLDRIKEAYEKETHDTNLMLVPYFHDAIERAERAWRRAVVLAIERGVAIPAFASSLAFFDGFRTERGPANLLQGLRDFFGSHTYERTDAKGAYHIRWSEDGAQIKTDS